MRTVLITGASSGIGQQLAIDLSQHYNLILTGRNSERLQHTAKACSGQTETLACDLTDSQAVADMFATLKDREIYGLVNNAGGIVRKTFTEHTDQDWLDMFEVNLMSAVRVTRECLKLMPDAGSIVNISSTLGLRSVAETAAYSAMKAAMNNWTRTLALELAPRQIRINSVCPGLVMTPIHQLEKMDPAEAEKLRGVMQEMQPMGRAGLPADITPMVKTCLDSSSGWTTGAFIKVDGGIEL